MEKGGEKRRGCRASWKDGKNQGSEGNGRTKAGRGGGKEEAYSITREKKGRQTRRNAGEAWNKRGNKKGREKRGRDSGVRCEPCCTAASFPARMRSTANASLFFSLSIATPARPHSSAALAANNTPVWYHVQVLSY